MSTLGICIPTFRRPAMLERCIRSAIRSAAGRPIRIFVADDSVSDVNKETLERLGAEFPFIRWERNAVNQGIDRNIQVALTLNDCDFGWLVGEDDRFLPDAVARMESLIQSTDEPFIFANYQFVTEDHQRVLGTPIAEVGSATLPVPEFVEAALWATGFIGCCLIRMVDWNRTDGQPFDGTYFTHVGRILTLLANRDSVRVARIPSIANRSQGEDTFTWKRDAFGVFLGFERMCALASALLPVHREALRVAVENYRRKFAYFSIKSTFRLRSQGAFDFRQFRVHVLPTRLAVWRKAWMLGLALAPRALLRPLALWYVKHQEHRARALGAPR